MAWAWDTAECLNKSRRWGDLAMHSGLLVLSLGLFSFNMFFEIPHFYKNYSRAAAGMEDDTVASEATSMFECMQDPDGPIWVRRLPFFFCYFFGCSWSSVLICYRYLGTLDFFPLAPSLRRGRSMPSHPGLAEKPQMAKSKSA